MQYRNTKTGAVINIKSKISGGYWQENEPARPTVTMKRQTDGRKKKVNKEDG